ncbi:MAG: sulfurtransferase complex subunit TusB [Candidatus Eutrophobiaceae bacterium]
MLHIVRHSPYGNEGMDALFDALQAGDAVAFVEDAVYVVRDSAMMARLQGLEEISAHALREDLQVRGLLDHAYAGLLIDYAALVDLICGNPQLQCWP